MSGQRNVNELYSLWRERAVLDPDLQTELAGIKNDDSAVADRFYRDLEFGTGGLRGVIGAGTNRVNVYTVMRTTQGLADYLNSKPGASRSVAIAYDSRIKSDLFARLAAETLAANGIQVHITPELAPTPMLSFAVRVLGCGAGIVITASHNPAKYNGYKAYGSDGCQLNLEDSAIVLEKIEHVDMFEGVKRVDFDAAV
ncbi:MAG: phospho-sugar mutase, partial [Oscillospiraceae bacterium]|nr:phospho-sugar mutase [Oscillospiraceae bacterium]